MVSFGNRTSDMSAYIILKMAPIKKSKIMAICRYPDQFAPGSPTEKTYDSYGTSKPNHGTKRQQKIAAERSGPWLFECLNAGMRAIEIAVPTNNKIGAVLNVYA